MAEVYRAQYMGREHSVGPGNEVVVKRIKPALFKAAEYPIFREMFLNEAKLVRSLQHANLARVYALLEAVDREHGTKVPFIVGEYIKGSPLWDLMRIATHGFTGRGIAPAIAAYIAREMARGLGHAHAHQDAATGRPQPIIHRDISPENVMVSEDGKVKVIDFGVAKAIGGFGPQTQTGIIKGKLAYMAPEQVAQKVVPATDVFGAGIVLHEMLTGRRLFAAGNEYLVVNNVLKAEIPPPSKTTRGIPKELEQVLMTALSRDLAVRYVDGNAFADALTEVMKQVTFLRGTTQNSIKRWREQALAEGARIASGWEGESSDDNLAAAEVLRVPESSIEGEIELSGEEVIFDGLHGEVDPAVRAAVTMGLKTLKPEHLHRRSERSLSAVGPDGQPRQPEPLPLPGIPQSTVSGRPVPPPPPVPKSRRPSQPVSQISAPPEMSGEAPPIPTVDPNVSTPDVAASTDKRLLPVPAASSAGGTTTAVRAPWQTALHNMLADPQTVRWLSALATLTLIVIMLLVILLLRC